MRDFLPADVRKREYVIGIIKEVYESYGFEPLETPAVENIETLMGKYGEEGNQLIFKILKRGEKLDFANANSESDLSDLALRYDLTVPLARVVANHKNDLPKFFKRYQIQPVWRADRPARGRFREFYQCDVDCIGSESMVVEAEIISASIDILTRLGFKDVAVLVNHRDFLAGILEISGVKATDQTAALVILDKLDKIGAEGVARELVQKNIFSSNRAAQFVELVWREIYVQMLPVRDVPRTHAERKLEEYDDNLFILEKFEGLLDASTRGKFGVTALRDLLTLLGRNDTTRISFQPSLARGLSYYTGAIIEFGFDEGDFQGSIGGGGRYDGLIGMFGKEHIPACGFSLGLERILVVMEERGMFPSEIADSTPADVMVTIWNDETIADSLKLANELRSQGLRVTVYPQADKEDKQWKYANSIQVPWICTMNDKDIAEGMVSFQNLRTRERFREPSNKVADIISSSK